jgi:HCOMODA/2-hydroxy-3-carboxy-muconic semialdehyde decarboxylase
MASPRKSLIIANRIFAHHGVLDAYGHVSIRDPENPKQFIMSRARAPELVTEDDLLVLNLEGEVVEEGRGGPYSERFIHAAVYEARPEIQAVVHAHTPSIIPFGITDIPLRAAFHIGAVVGKHVPTWDIADEFGPTNMLVTNMAQGRSLVKVLGANQMALMRGHGCVCVGRSIQDVTRTGVYMDVNARVATTAHLMSGGKVKYLSPEEMQMRLTQGGGPPRPAGEARAPRGMDGERSSREWEAWSAEVGMADE